MTRGTIDITPDKSLIRKLGSTGYSTVAAMAELVDNSIDARINSKITVKITLDIQNKIITVSDNGKGMNLDELKNAMILAKEKNRKNKSLGKFGLGLKTSCSTLGKKFRIVTTNFNSNKNFLVLYDEKIWEDDINLDWGKFPYKTSRKTFDNKHGTEITIDDLKIPLYHGIIKRIMDNFGERYANYIKSGQLKIMVNGRNCYIKEPKIEKNSTKKFIIRYHGKKIPVEISLLKIRSIKGAYGMDLYYRNRLIKAHSTFGIKKHPTIAKVIGKIHLDHVPINFHKTDFIKESIEYIDAEREFAKHPIVLKTLSEQSRIKTSTLIIRQICDYILGKTTIVPKLDIRANSLASIKNIINALPEMQFKSKGKTVEIKFDDSKNLYSTNMSNNIMTVTIGKKNSVFKTTKNPIYILAMIISEVRAMLESNSNVENFLKLRNSSWIKLIDSLEVKKIPEKKLFGYGIVSNLKGLYEYLCENYDNRFEFTALCTLEPFTRYVLNTPIYSIYTENSGGTFLLDTIRKYSDDYIVLLDPTSDTLQTILNMNYDKICIIVREFVLNELTDKMANPEKAWADLWREKYLYKSPISDEDISTILSKLVKEKVVNETKLKNLASRRSMKGMKPMLENVFTT
ncbi:MAG: hypothetical protein K8823_1006 [Cenarchaeum symbiont of Oopsacas minuta]|nr:hypothetical protein [Cenarchaeum symbiont of Oopsacas minuta]